MALVTALIGFGSIVGTASTLSFFTGTSLGFVAFAIDKAVLPPKHVIHYTFKIGLDGAGSNEGHDPLEGAGGTVPHIRVFDNHGKYLGRSMDRVVCQDGEDNCVHKVSPIKQQPAYALLSGRTNTVCLAAVGVTYPSGDQYGWVGNWAHSCCQPWYYSDIDAQVENGTVKLDCVWLGAKGYKRGYSTGIRIHFPEFKKGFSGNGNDEQYYCKGNNTALAFYNNKDPKYFDGTNQEHRYALKKAEKEAKKKAKEAKKQAKQASKAAKDAEKAEKDAQKAEKDKKEAKKPKTAQRRSTMVMETRSIQSYHHGHSATFLCKSETSVGPSLVSFPERTFCHMPDKVLYKFCEDVESGACWNEKSHSFDAKGPGAIHARAALPAIKFDAPLVWGKK
ncbi:hypothetical protein EsDP_00006773 [Epichloe bromicola]|uniref:Uncharacterized protein n=1 Tax=Epichloe bromicola TaxID=79588 RepID=A0ABQ0CYL8_9HYPO